MENYNTFYFEYNGTIEGKQYSVDVIGTDLFDGVYEIDVEVNGINIASWHRLERNTRLKADKSVLNEYCQYLDGVIRYLDTNLSEFVLTERTIKARVSGDFVSTNILGLESLNTASIRSVESGECLSWHYHNVFNNGEVELTVRREIVKNGFGVGQSELRVYAADSKLYDATKLQSLIDSDAFKQEQYSFFFYNEARRLAGLKHGKVKAMSGLFK